MIRVELKKKWINDFGKVYAVGTILSLSDSLANKLISAGTGKIYNGKYPPKKKVKTDFFNPNK
jgi:hypothetical protein